MTYLRNFFNKKDALSSYLEPWFTKGLIIPRRKKLQLGKAAALHALPVSRDKYKHFRNIYKRVIKLAKKFILKGS
jgi:hypothetical protein